MIDIHFSPDHYIFQLHLIQFFFFKYGWTTFLLNVAIDLYSYKFQKPNQLSWNIKFNCFCLLHRYLHWKIREHFCSFVPGLLFIGGLSFSTITFYINVLSCHYCVRLLTRRSSYMLSYLPNVIVILILHLNYTIFVSARQWTESVREADIPSALQEIQRGLLS
jgi:hypothetical protein